MKITHMGMIMNSLNQCKVCQDCPKFEICSLSTHPTLHYLWLVNPFFPQPLFSKCSLNTSDHKAYCRQWGYTMNKADADEEFPVKIQQRNPRNKELQQCTLHIHHSQDTQDPGVTWNRNTQLSSQRVRLSQVSESGMGGGNQLMQKA